MEQLFKTFRFGDDTESPNKIINPNLIDPLVRLEDNQLHPFPDQRSGKWRGCYLFYADICKGYNIALYAGQTVNLGIRLHQHWNGHYSRLNGWLPSVLDRLLDYDSEVHAELLSSMFFAYWLIPEKKERALFEHKLIGNLKPICNIN